MFKDNYDYFKEYDRAQEDRLRQLPVCACCGEPIQDETMYGIDGWYCEECKDIFLANISKNVEDWVYEQRGAM